MDAVHGGARAGHRVQAEHRLIGVVDGQPVHQADLGADSPLAAGRGGVDFLADVLGGPDHVGRLDRLHGTFRVDHDIDIGVEDPRCFYLADGEPGVDRAMALPQHHLGPAELLRRVAAQRPEGVPDHHLIEGHSQVQSRVAAQVLVGQEEDPPGLGKGPLQHCLGVR